MDNYIDNYLDTFLDSSSAFDSRNEPDDLWDACLPCNENSVNPGQRDNSNMNLFSSNGPKSVLQETNSYIAQTLNKLPINERDHALNDIHGVADLDEEGKEFLEKQLHLLDVELGKIKDKNAYLIAKSMSETYVSNPKFRLKFLRAELFDAKNAASRLVRHFDVKLDIFGKEKLAKDITLRDLPEEDLIHFKKGYFQPFLVRDSTGRLIMCSYSIIAATIPLETRRRILWYNYNTVAEDEDTQRKGVVLIIFSIGQAQCSENAGKVGVMVTAMPVRFGAIHFCYDQDVVPLVLQLFKRNFRHKDLSRVRIHYTSRLECAYTLITFGIPRTIFDSNGEPNTSLVHDWLKKRMLEEDGRTVFKSNLIVPSNYDVLFGRGNRILGHTGNIRCRDIMDMYKDRYEQSSKSDKNVICLIILSKIKEQGGRFLKEVDSGWTEVDDEVAKSKISHDYRNSRRSVKSIAGRKSKHSFS